MYSFGHEHGEIIAWESGDVTGVICIDIAWAPCCRQRCLDEKVRKR
jgi:hypothetical protein